MNCKLQVEKRVAEGKLGAGSYTVGRLRRCLRWAPLLLCLTAGMLVYPACTQLAAQDTVPDPLPASPRANPDSAKTAVASAKAAEPELNTSEPALKAKEERGEKTQKVAIQIPRVVSINSPSPLYTVQIMFMAGSVDDPPGREGLAGLVANAILEGGFGDPKFPVTKLKLAEITRPWGSEAMPSVHVDKQTTTFSMKVPKEVFPQFVNTVLKPMFSQPLFQAEEIERLRKEALADLQSHLRFEQQELLGLEALESAIYHDTPMCSPSIGTVNGLNAIRRQDMLDFYARFYTANDAAVAASADGEAMALLKSVLPVRAHPPQQMCACIVQPPGGRDLLIVTQPNAIATGIHFGFPIDVLRSNPDYWPLFVANTYLGLHRDDFGRLYQEIREARGYNYGDYSYIEYLSGRPYFLFPPPATPRSLQYFSVWIRPVAHEYAHFILKAATAELARFVQEGMTAAQVEEAKVKARTLYLSYAENVERQLGYRLDDTFYAMYTHGYLIDMLKNIDEVTPERVNDAIRRNLQVSDMHYVITTNDSTAPRLADDIANGTHVISKTPEEYHLPNPVPPDKKALLAQDQQWKDYALRIPRDHIHIVKSEQLYQSAALPFQEKAAPAAGR